MERVRPILQGFAQANVAMQAFFREWAEMEQGVEAAGSFVDYAEIPFLAELNRKLLEDCDDEEILAQLDRNLKLARQLRQEIIAAAGRADRSAANQRDIFPRYYQKRVSGRAALILLIFRIGRSSA